MQGGHLRPSAVYANSHHVMVAHRAKSPMWAMFLGLFTAIVVNVRSHEKEDQMVATAEQIAASSHFPISRLRLKRHPSVWAGFDQRGRGAQRVALAASLARNPAALGRETGARC